jgi:hypothetical protein
MIRLILETPLIIEIVGLLLSTLSLITYPTLRQKVSTSLHINNTLFVHLIATFLYIFVVIPLIWSALNTVLVMCRLALSSILPLIPQLMLIINLIWPLGSHTEPHTTPHSPPQNTTPHSPPQNATPHLTPQEVKSQVDSLVDEGLYLAEQNKCDEARNDQNRILGILKQNQISINMHDNLTPIEQEIQVSFTNLMSGVLSCNARASFFRYQH